MAEAAPDGTPDARQPLIVRTAEWLGRALGKWRRGRIQKRDDAYIRVWKAAWVAGLRIAMARPDRKKSVPHSSGAEHDAWLAGWAWGDTAARSARCLEAGQPRPPEKARHRPA